MHTNRTFRLDDDEVEAIFLRLQSHRLPEVYDNNSLKDLHEVLVSVFNSDVWKNPKHYEQRKVFIQAIGGLNGAPADHRRVFLAMAEASNSHGVVEYLHTLDSKERVFLKDHSALITTDELAQMFRDQGSRMGAVSHFLSRAVTAGMPGSVPTLWKEMVKAFDPDAKFKERMQEGMATMVRRFGLKSLGLGKDDMDHKPWVEKFFTTEIEQVQGVASAVLAGQIAKKRISKEDLLGECREFSSQMRLVNNLGFNMEDFGVKAVIRSDEAKKPAYGIGYQLTR